jgi:protein-disulfide isomerase
MSDRFEKTAVVVLCLTAIVMAGTMVRRASGVAGPRSVPEGPPTLVSDWESLSATAIAMGDPGNPVRVLEFADFECPFCRKFDSTMRAIQAANPKTVTRLFVHHPLKMHRFAVPAARAAECAGEQSKFSAMHDLLFAKQDSLGLKSWSSYAHEAGISNTAAFERCIGRTTPFARIEAGTALAEAYQVKGTPTVIINGWRFSRPPNDSVLLLSIREFAAGKGPTAR